MKKREVKEKLNYYLSLNYPILIAFEKDDGVYVVQYPDLPGCMAHGSTPTKAVKLAELIKKEWIESALEDGHAVPVPKTESEYSGKFIIRIPPALHKRLSEQAEREGRSLNQHVGVLLSERSAALTIEEALKKPLEKLERYTENLDAQRAVQEQNSFKIEGNVGKAEETRLIKDSTPSTAIH